MFRQRGALTVITPLLMLLVILLGVMALDGARLFSLRKEMQSQVNAAATAAADAAQACGGEVITLGNMRERALAAARAQGFEGEDGDLDVVAGLLSDSDGDGDVAFSETDFLDQTNAVLVRYQREEPISLLLPDGIFGSVTVDVNAAARKEVVATVSAAGGTAGVDGGLLGGLLGAILNQPNYTLDPTSLSSLRNTTVQLGELLTALEVDTVTQLLGLSGEDFAEGLGAIGGIAAPVASLLDELASAVGVETIQVRDVLDVVENASVPQGSEFPLYDVVISLVLNLAEQQQPGENGLLALPIDIDLGLPGLANVTAVVNLNVGEPSKVVIGPARRDEDGEWLTKFYAPDVTLLVDATVDVLSLPGVSVGVADIKLPLAVNAGGGDGAFVSARCARGVENEVLIGMEINRSVASIVSGGINPSTGEPQLSPIKIDLLKILPFLPSVLSVSAEITGGVPGFSQSVLLDPEYPLYCAGEDDCVQVAFEDYGQGLSGLDLDIDVDDTALLGLPLGWLLNPLMQGLSSLLDDVVSLLAEALINPLLDTIGLGLGSLTVTVSNANQDAVQLVEDVEIQDI